MEDRRDAPGRLLSGAGLFSGNRAGGAESIQLHRDQYLDAGGRQWRGGIERVRAFRGGDGANRRLFADPVVGCDGETGNTTTVQLYGGGTFAANDCAKFERRATWCRRAGRAPGEGWAGGHGNYSNDRKRALDGYGGFRGFVPGVVTSVTNLDFPSIDPQTCAEQDVALTGAALGSALAAGWPAAIEAGLVGNMRVSAASTVTIRLCNVTADAIDPAAADFRVTVFISL